MTVGARRPDHVALLGMMGAGKTTTGTALAARLGWELWDSDQQIEERTGTSGAVLAAREGVEALHELEARILLDALESTEPLVVGAAASVVDSPRCRATLRRFALVVWLDAPIGVLTRRRRGGTHRRPVARSVDLATMEARQEYFADVADLRLEATAPTDQLVDTIVGELRSPGDVDTAHRLDAPDSRSQR